MKFKWIDLIASGVFLTACSVQGPKSTMPVVGTCDEFSYDMKTRTRTVVILPIRGEVIYSTRQIRIGLKSNLAIFGYPVLVCKGQQENDNNQNVVEVDLTCQDNSFGTAFMNLGQDKYGIGNGQFALSNGTYGTFQFGPGLLLTSKS